MESYEGACGLILVKALVVAKVSVYLVETMVKRRSRSCEHTYSRDWPPRDRQEMRRRYGEIHVHVVKTLNISILETVAATTGIFQVGHRWPLV